MTPTNGLNLLLGHRKEAMGWTPGRSVRGDRAAGPRGGSHSGQLREGGAVPAPCNGEGGRRWLGPAGTPAATPAPVERARVQLGGRGDCRPGDTLPPPPQESRRGDRCWLCGHVVALRHSRAMGGAGPERLGALGVPCPDLPAGCPGWFPHVENEAEESGRTLSSHMLSSGEKEAEGRRRNPSVLFSRIHYCRALTWGSFSPVALGLTKQRSRGQAEVRTRTSATPAPCAGRHPRAQPGRALTWARFSVTKKSSVRARCRGRRMPGCVTSSSRLRSM